jgi:hypothetical protein
VGEAITSQAATPDGLGYDQHFNRVTPQKNMLAAIDSTTYGTYAVLEPIADRFASLGWEAFGEATTDTTQGQSHRVSS